MLHTDGVAGVKWRGERNRKTWSNRSQGVTGAGHCQPLRFSLNGTETTEEFGTWERYELPCILREWL